MKNYSGEYARNTINSFQLKTSHGRMSWRIRPCRTQQDSNLLKGDAECAEINLAQGLRGGISPQILLCLLNQRHQVSQQLPNPWLLLWIPSGIDRHDGDACADLIKGQQGLLQQF